MNNFWTISIGDILSGIGLLVIVYRIVINHLWHLKQDLQELQNQSLKAIKSVETKLDEHIKWHLDQ